VAPHDVTRFGVASVVPVRLERATLGEFVHVRTCVVEFSVAPEGIPLDRFTTWGELAAAADAARGELLVALPAEPEAS
jgi:hypothetical protein